MSARPYLSLQEAVQLAKGQFGLDTDLSNAAELPSYIDRNFLLPLRGRGGDGPEAVVLKLLNAEDSMHVEFVAAQNAAMRHLTDAGIVCTRLVLGTSGRDMETVDLGASPADGTNPGRITTRHLLRCFEYIPGTVLGQALEVGHMPLDPFGDGRWGLESVFLPWPTAVIAYLPAPVAPLIRQPPVSDLYHLMVCQGFHSSSSAGFCSFAPGPAHPLLLPGAHPGPGQHVPLSLQPQRTLLPAHPRVVLRDPRRRGEADASPPAWPADASPKVWAC